MSLQSDDVQRQMMQDRTESRRHKAHSYTDDMANDTPGLGATSAAGATGISQAPQGTKTILMALSIL